MSDEPWTIGRLLNWTTDFLREKGADSPRLDAEVLLAHARNCQRIQLYTMFEEEAPAALLGSFRELVGRRAQGTPVAYLVGYREFFSLRFRVTPDVLIPRPETELLVVRLLDLAQQVPAGRPALIADVGTGSGVLAVCCAKHLPTARVSALDISPAALEVAQQNAAEHGVSEQIEFHCGDLLADCELTDLDFVVSNPPYVASAEMKTLDPGVREHEPHLALEGGPTGTEIIQRLIPQAAERLRSGGWLLIEIGPSTVERTEQLVSENAQLRLEPTLKDLAGQPRVVQAQKRET